MYVFFFFFFLDHDETTLLTFAFPAIEIEVIKTRKFYDFAITRQ